MVDSLKVRACGLHKGDILFSIIAVTYSKHALKCMHSFNIWRRRRRLFSIITIHYFYESQDTDNSLAEESIKIPGWRCFCTVFHRKQIKEALVKHCTGNTRAANRCFRASYLTDATCALAAHWLSLFSLKTSLVVGLSWRPLPHCCCLTAACCTNVSLAQTMSDMGGSASSIRFLFFHFRLKFY